MCHCARLWSSTTLHAAVTSEQKWHCGMIRSPANLGEVHVRQCRIDEVPYILKQLSAGPGIWVLPLKIHIPRLRHSPLLSLGWLSSEFVQKSPGLFLLFQHPIWFSICPRKSLQLDIKSLMSWLYARPQTLLPHWILMVTAPLRS